MIQSTSEPASAIPPQVFISYGRADAARVLEIARLLEAEGVTVWCHGDRILGGKYYGQEIAQAIAHSRVVLLMGSPHAFQSDNVHREVLLTWEYAHRRYVPVWLAPASEIPLRYRFCLAGCQWIDAHSQPQEKWLPQLLESLRAHGVGTTSESAQLAAPAPRPLVHAARLESRSPWTTKRLFIAAVILGLAALVGVMLLRRGDKKVFESFYTPKVEVVVRKDSEPPAPADPEYITTRVGQIKLKRIPERTFMMGSPDDDKEADDDEKRQHRVRITRPFYLGVYEVTQAQYEAVMGNNPSWFSAAGDGKDKVAGQSTDRHPVENVSWLDAVKFCKKLSEMEGQPAFYEIDGEKVVARDWNRAGYRLPTEAEWEYACRANAPTVTRYSFGDDASSLGEFGWFGDNSGGTTHPVGEKHRNGLGLFDMHGNVWEWCWDGYKKDYYKESLEDDPRGFDGASRRVYRGGGWYSVPRDARSAFRFWCEPGTRINDLGFRVALVQSGR